MSRPALLSLLSLLVFTSCGPADEETPWAESAEPTIERPVPAEDTVDSTPPVDTSPPEDTDDTSGGTTDTTVPQDSSGETDTGDSEGTVVDTSPDADSDDPGPPEDTARPFFYDELRSLLSRAVSFLSNL